MDIDSTKLNKSIPMTLILNELLTIEYFALTEHWGHLVRTSGSFSKYYSTIENCFD